MNLLKSRKTGATGLAFSYIEWAFDFGDSAVSFVSHLEVPTFFYLKNDGSVRLYIVDFNGDFVIDKDWSNVRVNLITYDVSPSSAYEIFDIERNVACK